MKNGHLKVRTQSTVKYSYTPESFVMIMCVLWTMSDIGKRLSDNILKTERVVSFNPTFNKSFGTHAFYQEGGGVGRTPCYLKTHYPYVGY